MAEMQVVIMSKQDKLGVKFLGQTTQNTPAEDKLVLCAFLQIIAQVGIRNSELTPSEYNNEGENNESKNKR